MATGDQRGLKIITAIFFALVSSISFANTFHLVEEKESEYNDIFIYDYGSFYSMIFGYNKRLYEESLFNKNDDLDLPVAYTRFMTVGLAYASSLNNVVEVGLGGGRTSWYIHKSLPNVEVRTVELDPAVAALAAKYFGIHPERNFEIVIQDGRRYLYENKLKSDVILLDAYRGPFVPFHLLTKEFYQLVKSRLNEGGVLVQNIEPSTMLFDAAMNTIHSVFAHLDVYRAEGNIVVVAYDGAPKSQAEISAQADLLDSRNSLRYKTVELLKSRHEFNGEQAFVDQKAPILTDDFAPVDTLKAIKAHNRKWN